MALIANMIGRNEAGRYLPQVLESLSVFVDRIVFTDDASTDNTAQIASDSGAYVLQLEEPMFTKNEGELRSLSWHFLETFASPGDWILSVDADEVFWGAEYLSDFLDQSRYDVLGVTFVHMWNPTHYRVDKAWKPHLSSRLFRFKQGGDFLKRKLACGAEPTYVIEAIRQGRVFWGTPFVFQHLGYVSDVDKIVKYRRYKELDGGDFHNLAHIESIMDPEPTLIEWNPALLNVQGV